MNKKIKSLLLFCVIVSNFVVATVANAGLTHVDAEAKLKEFMLKAHATLDLTNFHIIDPAGAAKVQLMLSDGTPSILPDGTPEARDIDIGFDAAFSSVIEDFPRTIPTYISLLPAVKTSRADLQTEITKEQGLITALETEITAATAGGIDTSMAVTALTEAKTQLTASQTSLAEMDKVINAYDTSGTPRAMPMPSHRATTTATLSTAAGDLAAQTTVLKNLIDSIFTSSTGSMKAIDATYQKIQSLVHNITSLASTFLISARPVHPITSSSGTPSTGTPGTPPAPHLPPGFKKPHKTMPAPKIGQGYTQVINDLTTTNNQLMQRRLINLHGFWISGSIPFIEKSLKSNPEGVEFNTKHVHVMIGYDQIINRMFTLGAFIKHNQNTGTKRSDTFKQNSQFNSIGGYFGYKDNSHFYIADKFSYNQNKFKNQEMVKKTKSYLNLDGFNNEFSVGYQFRNNLNIEIFLNTLYLLPEKFEQQAKRTLSGGKILDASGKINSNIYNGAGFRTFWQAKKSITNSMRILPFMHAQFESPINAMELKGSYSYPNMTALDTYERSVYDVLPKYNYGLSIGTTMSAKYHAHVVTTIAYHLNHVGNTAHGLDISFNIKL